MILLIKLKKTKQKRGGGISLKHHCNHQNHHQRHHHESDGRMGSWKTIAAQSITLTPHHSILSPQNFVFLSPPSQDFFFLPSQYFYSSKVRISPAPPTLFSPSVIPLRVTDMPAGKIDIFYRNTFRIDIHLSVNLSNMSL